MANSTITLEQLLRAQIDTTIAAVRPQEASLTVRIAPAEPTDITGHGAPYIMIDEPLQPVHAGPMPFPWATEEIPLPPVQAEAMPLPPKMPANLRGLSIDKQRAILNEILRGGYGFKYSQPEDKYKGYVLDKIWGSRIGEAPEVRVGDRYVVIRASGTISETTVCCSALQIHDYPDYNRTFRSPPIPSTNDKMLLVIVEKPIIHDPTFLNE